MYDPSEVGKKGAVFGLPYTTEEADLILLPVHLDVTVSYGCGTSKAPDIILNESSQLDLSLVSIAHPWQLKVAMDKRIISKSQNEIQRGRAFNVIKALESGKKADQEQIQYINEFSEKAKTTIYEHSKSIIESGKHIAVIGGDHSSPLGLMEALAEKYAFGILQLDAHMDLRKAYEGFTYSHASIMRNAMEIEQVQSLTQVGIRDYCEEEENYIQKAAKPIHVFYDETLKEAQFHGKSWSNQVDEIIETLPENVYVSFDVDGLEPSLCPNTGTPVPGGLQFNESCYLLEQVVKSGRKIIGFDVCETGSATWDANVSSRILFRLSALQGVSLGLLRFA